MSDTGPREIGLVVLRALAQIVGGLLALFGGGCVIVGAWVLLSGGVRDGLGMLGGVLAVGVVPLGIGIGLFRWGHRRPTKL